MRVKFSSSSMQFSCEKTVQYSSHGYLRPHCTIYYVFKYILHPKLKARKHNSESSRHRLVSDLGTFLYLDFFQLCNADFRHTIKIVLNPRDASAYQEYAVFGALLLVLFFCEYARVDNTLNLLMLQYSYVHAHFAQYMHMDDTEILSICMY